jgi:hypothetical protein
MCRAHIAGLAPPAPEIAPFTQQFHNFELSIQPGKAVGTARFFLQEGWIIPGDSYGVKKKV